MARRSALVAPAAGWDGMFEYDRVCGAFWDAVIDRNGKAAIKESAERYQRAAER